MNEHNVATPLLGPGGLIGALRRRLWAVVLCFVTVVGVAVALTLAQEEQYSATATLLFRDPQLDQKLFGSDFDEDKDPAREAETNVDLVSLDVVADRTARALDRFSGGEVEERVEVTAEGLSDLISMTATHTDPAVAAEIANTFARQYIEFRQDADRRKIQQAQELVERELSELESAGGDPSAQRSLAERLEQLTVLASLQTGNAELVQRPEAPDSPSSPSLKTNIALGVVFGLLLGIAVAILLDRIDRRIREPDEIEQILKRPVLGVIPHSRALPKEGANVEELPAGELEAFRIIRANLRYFDASSEVKSVLITSAGPADGKTTVAWNVAAAAASAGARVVVVEADLRRPALEHRLGARVPVGLSAVLAGVADLDDAVIEVPINERQGMDEQALRWVDVIFAGTVPPNPTDLMDSERMEALLRRLESRYDAVFIDSPPVSAVSDAIPLLARVNGILVVTRLNQTTRDALLRLATQLDNLGARTLGTVVNGVAVRRGGYGYGYGYGYEYEPEPKRPREQPARAFASYRPGGNGAPPETAPQEREGHRQ